MLRLRVIPPATRKVSALSTVRNPPLLPQLVTCCRRKFCPPKPIRLLMIRPSGQKWTFFAPLPTLPTSVQLPRLHQNPQIGLWFRAAPRASGMQRLVYNEFGSTSQIYSEPLLASLSNIAHICIHGVQETRKWRLRLTIGNTMSYRVVTNSGSQRLGRRSQGLDTSMLNGKSTVRSSWNISSLAKSRKVYLTVILRNECNAAMALPFLT